jgi:hypothetical protein
VRLLVDVSAGRAVVESLKQLGHDVADVRNRIR